MLAGYEYQSMFYDYVKICIDALPYNMLALTFPMLYNFEKLIVE
jgi:hypothetical protein